MDFEEESVVKSVALFMSFILVVAIMGWTMPLVVAQEEKLPEIECFSCIQKILNGEKDTFDWKIDIVDKDNLVVEYGGEKGTTTLDKLRGGLGGNDVITFGEGDDERSISLKDLPDGLESIEVKDGKVTYTMKGDKPGKVNVGQKGVTLIKNAKGEAVLKGTLADKNEGVVVSLGENGEINVDDAGISYKGTGTSLTVDKNIFEAVGDKAGSVKFVEGNPANFVVKSSKVNNDEYGLSVGEGGVYMGDPAKIPKDMKVKGKERYLSLAGSELNGNLNGLDKSAGEELIFTNKGDKKMVEKITGTNVDIPGTKEATFFKSDKGEVDVKVDKASGATAPNAAGTGTSTGTPSNGPDLPTTPGTGGVNGSDTTPPIDPPVDDDPTDDYDPNGDGGGGSNWLMWALIIGAVALAAMLLLGGKDDKGDEKPNDGIDDGGEPYMGKDNDTDVTKEIRSKDGQDNKTIIYSPTPKAGGCTYDAEGYKNCPDNDCSQCGVGTRPLIQGGDDDGDEGDGDGETGDGDGDGDSEF